MASEGDAPAGGALPPAPPATSAAVRVRMQGNRRRDTTPELALRRELHRRGRRFRVDHPPLQGVRRRADLVFPRHRVSVFVDGCFWHSCPQHGTTPSRNAVYWVEKLARNRDRDAETDRLLGDAGWVSMRIWEHEPVDAAADAVEAVLDARDPERGGPREPRPGV